MTSNHPTFETREGFSVFEVPGRQLIHHYHKHCPWSADDKWFLAMDFSRGDNKALIRVFDTLTGDSRVVGQSLAWDEHSGADPFFWLGEGNTVFFRESERTSAGGSVYSYAIRSAAPGGISRSFESPVKVADAGHGCLVGSVAPATDTAGAGVARLDPETGAHTMLCSVQDAVAAHPEPGIFDGLYVHTKMEQIHRQMPWVLFKLVGKRGGPADPPLRSALCAVHLETREVRFLGPVVHHPSWHPREPLAIAFADDAEGRRGLATYRMREDGSAEQTFLNIFSETGHPTFDPTGRWIAYDTYVDAGTRVRIHLVPTDGGDPRTVADYPRAAYAPDGSVTGIGGESGGDGGAFFANNYGASAVFRIQAHPVWDHTGRCLAFNSDRDGTTRVWVADLDALHLRQAI